MNDMSNIQTEFDNVEQEYQSIKPVKWHRIYDLVKAAGVDVRFWEESKKTGMGIDPSTNTYQNSRWTFGGGDQPLVACIWWKEILRIENHLERASSSKQHILHMSNLRAEQGLNSSTSRRLSVKIAKAQAFDRLISEAYRKRKQVRVVVLDGQLASEDDEATLASVAKYRFLDPHPWFVHEYDPFLGDYRLVRNIPPPPIQVKDPFQDAVDPADDIEFIDLLNSYRLTDTEKEAVIKSRVGQGFFRDELIKRWNGCSVKNCTEHSLLIASHIKPWRDCLTKFERLSPDNGLLLTPNLDKLFDRGLITFNEEDRYQLIISKRLNFLDLQALGIFKTDQIKPHNHEGMKPFMEYHRKNIFIDNRSI